MQDVREVGSAVAMLFHRGYHVGVSNLICANLDTEENLISRSTSSQAVLPGISCTRIIQRRATKLPGEDVARIERCSSAVTSVH